MTLVADQNNHNQLTTALDKLNLVKYKFGLDSNGSIVTEII